MKKIFFILLLLFSCTFFVSSISASSISASDANTLGQKAAEGIKPIKLDNPLGEGRVDIRTILGDIVTAGMGVLGSVTLLVFVYGGFLWLTSAGSAEKVKKGSQTMMWAVVGLFLIFGSYAILGLVLEGIGSKQQKEFTGLQLQDIDQNIGITDATAPVAPTEENPIVGNVCGDGVISNDGTEGCDDGATVDGDGCSSQCQIE